MVPDKAKLLMEEDDDDANEIVSYVEGADDSSGRPFAPSHASWFLSTADLHEQRAAALISAKRAFKMR